MQIAPSLGLGPGLGGGAAAGLPLGACGEAGRGERAEGGGRSLPWGISAQGSPTDGLAATHCSLHSLKGLLGCSWLCTHWPAR